jgi:hypothetical protein
LRNSGRFTSLGSRAFLGVLIDGLSRKEGVTRWKLRVAKRFTGTAREKLFADLRKSLDELELIVELIFNQPFLV